MEAAEHVQREEEKRTPNDSALRSSREPVEELVAAAVKKRITDI
jgi:hypothetical protein